MIKSTLDIGFKGYLKSISFLWNHKILWPYLLLPITSGLTDLYLKNRLYLQINFPQFPLIPEHLNPMLPAIGILIGTLGAALIIIHSFALLSEKQTSIGETFKTLFTRLLPVLLWASICVLALYLDHYITTYASSYLDKDEFRGIMAMLIKTSYAILKIGIQAITLLILPVLIFEQKPLFEAFKRGISLSKELIWAIIGGYLAIMGVGFIFSPLVLIATLFIDRLQLVDPIRILLTWIFLSPLVLIACAFFVFQAKLYHDYYKEMPE